MHHVIYNFIIFTYLDTYKLKLHKKVIFQFMARIILQI